MRVEITVKAANDAVKDPGAIKAERITECMHVERFRQPSHA